MRVVVVLVCGNMENNPNVKKLVIYGNNIVINVNNVYNSKKIYNV